MNRIALLAAGCAALALAACDHPDAARQKAEHALKAVSKLDCPEKQGLLTRVSVAPDGQSCEYRGDASEVTLRVVKVTESGAGDALKPIEADLRTLVPSTAPDQAALDKGAETSEDVNIKLPGVTIRANDAGANISAGGADIKAGEDGAEVRVTRNIEIDGKKVESERVTHRKDDDGMTAMLILADDKGTSGWNMVGYQARGPKGGPLVVGVIKAKGDQANEGDHDIFSDVGKLIRHNVGGRDTRFSRIGLN